MPVSLFTVARELGHEGIGQIAATYGHLQENPHRSLVVEYVATQVVPFRRRAAGGE